MNQKQRKAKLKRAQQHQKSAKTSYPHQVSGHQHTHKLGGVDTIKSAVTPAAREQSIEYTRALNDFLMAGASLTAQKPKRKPVWLLMWLSVLWFKVRFVKV